MQSKNYLLNQFKLDDLFDKATDGVRLVAHFRSILEWHWPINKTHSLALSHDENTFVHFKRTRILNYTQLVNSAIHKRTCRLINQVIRLPSIWMINCTRINSVAQKHSHRPKKTHINSILLLELIGAEKRDCEVWSHWRHCAHTVQTFSDNNEAEQLKKSAKNESKKVRKRMRKKSKPFKAKEPCGRIQAQHTYTIWSAFICGECQVAL